MIYYKLFSDPSWNRSEHMKWLHSQGRYIGTSKIGLWNVSDEKRQRMKEIYERNRLDKTSRGYGSEYWMRQANRTLLGDKFQGESGYFYFLDYPASVKVGFSKDWQRRVNKQLPKQILGGTVIAIISGPTKELAELEYSTMIKFQEYTKLDSTGTRYTEWLEKSQRLNIYRYLKDAVRKNPKLRFEIKKA